MSQQLHQQPGTVTTGATAPGQGFLRCLHPGLKTYEVANVPLHLLVELHQEIDRAECLLRGFENPGIQVILETLALRCDQQVGSQLLTQLSRHGERIVLGPWLQEEVERVVHRHFHHQVHRDLEFTGFSREYQTRLVIGKGVLLPVDEVSRLHPQAVGNHLPPRMRGWPQPNDLRSQLHRPVVSILRDVVKCCVDGHAPI